MSVQPGSIPRGASLASLPVSCLIIHPPPNTIAAPAQRFRRFAERECSGRLPLYERLALSIAEGPALLALAAHARSGQPIPNLLLAAVHFLLPQGRAHSTLWPPITLACPVGHPLPVTPSPLPHLLTGAPRGTSAADGDLPPG
ncbi:MAG: DUF2332 family protein [Chloroflexi bacterium]|nr:DUF2332 family protein [Chloroflexota bacterium]